MNKKLGIGIVAVCAIAVGFFFQVSMITGAPEPASVPTPSPSSVPFPVLIVSVVIGAISGAIVTSFILLYYLYFKQKSREGECCKRICNYACRIFLFGGIVGVIGIILLIVGIIILIFHRDYIPGIAIASLGLSLIAIGIANKSERRMEALTYLNFYEKMAMLENYMGDFCGKDGFETLLKKLIYDIKAESALKPWADRESLEKLITSLIQIIECAQKKNRDANGAYTEDICNLIEIALEVDPKNEVLLNLKSKCPPFLANRKEVKNE